MLAPATKLLVPPRRRDFLARPRLVQFLQGALDAKLTLIRAPAGYGKTTLLADFARQSSFPVAWLSLEAEDTDPARFLEVVVEALRQPFPHLGGRTLDALARDPGSALVQLINEIHQDLPDFTLLLLDDYHDVSPAIDPLLDRLLDLLPPNLRLLVASRTLPHLSMANLAAKGEMQGLSARDLAFTAQELQEYLALGRGLELSAAEAQELIQRSEGWITGILLTSQLLSQKVFDVLDRAPQVVLFDYLAREVFTRLSPTERDFLLRTSIFDILRPDLCDALLGIEGSAAILEDLESRDLLLHRLEAEGHDWYRYHQLFRDFLQARLGEEHAGQKERLHARAADLLRGEGQLREAVHHALTAGRWALAEALIAEQAEGLLAARQHETLLGWLRRLPELSPELSLLEGRAHIRGAQDHIAAEEPLRRAAESALLRGQALAWLSASLRLQMRLEEASLAAREALSLLHREPTPERAVALRNLGLCLWMLGDHELGRRHLEEALEAYTALGDPLGEGVLSQNLGRTYREEGRLEEAIRHYQRAIAEHRRAGNLDGEVYVLDSLGILQQRRGQFDRAGSVFDEALEKARAWGAPLMLGVVLGSQGELARDWGDLDRAGQLLERAQEQLERAGAVSERIAVLAARGEVAARAGDLEAGERLALMALQAAQEIDSLNAATIARLALAKIALLSGHPETAARELDAIPRVEDRDLEIRLRLHRVELGRVRQESGAKRDFRRALQQARRYGLLGIVVSEVAAFPGLVPWAKAERLKLPSAPIAVAPQPAPILEALALAGGRIVYRGRLVRTSRLGSASAREVLFYLLAHPQGASWAEVAAELWPDSSPDRARSHFHTCLYRLRQGTYTDLILHQDGLYRISRQGLRYDVEEFETLVAQAAGQSNEVELLERALALYRTPYLPGSYSDWSLRQRDRLEMAHVEALARLAVLYLRDGRLGEGTEIARRVLEHDPYREGLYREVIRAAATDGQADQALAWFRRCEEALGELGSQPARETRELVQPLN